ncbi:ABC transporter ATP-binding protein [Sessilibacter sp. MAH4]
MTSPVVKIRNLEKHYGRTQVVDIPQLDIEPGRIVGLIGPNGAGKTSTIRCLLGLSQFKGQLEVLGLNPYTDRSKLLKDVAFIADTAVLPKWINTQQLLDYMAKVHPNFNIEKAKRFLSQTNIRPTAKVKTLSKGMMTQLHLALVIAVEAKLLLLDEPTLGLDIIYRQQFYEQLLNDFFEEDRTIIITTHQVEEIETILTDLIFINQGSVVLNVAMDDIASRFVELTVSSDNYQQAKALNPIRERSNLGNTIFTFEDTDPQLLTNLGRMNTPSLSNLFIAKCAQDSAKGVQS